MKHRKTELDLKNKRGLYNYEIIETYECGIVLTGDEFKAIRNKSVSFNDSSHAYVSNNEVFLTNLSMTSNEFSNSSQDEHNRPKKLLLHKSEIRMIKKKVNEKGLTLVPVRLYQVGRLIKLELAVAKGLKNVDKRKKMKDKDLMRDAQREAKNY